MNLGELQQPAAMKFLLLLVKDLGPQPASLGNAATRRKCGQTQQPHRILLIQTIGQHLMCRDHFVPYETEHLINRR